jgi:hypothetical protein
LSPFYFYQEQLVFADETCKDARDFRRIYGWSRRGEACVSEESSSRGDRLSILAALDIHGFFAYEATDGTFDRRAFHNALVKKILPRMNPWPLPRSILIMDNARIHAYEELFRTVEAFGVCLVFLPPYCPDLNPIEYAFKDFKTWIQNFPGASTVWNLDPIACTDTAMKNCSSDMRRTFSHCGYRFDGMLDFSASLRRQDADL